LKFQVSAKALRDFTTSINMNTFGEYLKEELGSTSKGSGLIDLSLENWGPASSKILKGIIKVEVNKMIEKIKPIEVGGNGPKVTN